MSTNSSESEDSKSFTDSNSNINSSTHGDSASVGNSSSSGSSFVRQETRGVKRSKIVVCIVMGLAAVAVGGLTYHFVRREETVIFENAVSTYSWKHQTSR